MAFLIAPLFTCVVQGCCWYSVFKCCGCIEDRNHVEIDKQKAEPVLVMRSSNNNNNNNNNPFTPSQIQTKNSNSDNPFVNPGAAKECLRSAYG